MTDTIDSYVAQCEANGARYVTEIRWSARTNAYPDGHRSAIMATGLGISYVVSDRCDETRYKLFGVPANWDLNAWAFIGALMVPHMVSHYRLPGARLMDGTTPSFSELDPSVGYAPVNMHANYANTPRRFYVIETAANKESDS